MICKTPLLIFACCSVLLSSSLAKEREEDEAMALLNKATEQTDVWSKQHPLSLDAEIRLLQMKSGEIEAAYSMVWASEKQWRSEWSARGYSEIYLRGNGATWHLRNVKDEPVRMMQFEWALSALSKRHKDSPFNDGSKVQPSKYKISSKKIDGEAAQCVETFVDSALMDRVCVDKASGLPLRITNSFGTYEYGEYESFRNSSFPARIRVLEGTYVVLEAKLKMREATPDKALFVPPPGSEETKDSPCADSHGIFVDHTDMHGSLLEKKQPIYPQYARTNHQTGTVMMLALIGKDGSVQRLRVIQSAGPDLDKAALDAVKQWRYKSFLRCGEPVAVESTLVVNFELRP